MKKYFRIVFLVLLAILSTLLVFLIIKQWQLKQESSVATNDQEVTLVSSTEVAQIYCRSQYIAESLSGETGFCAMPPRWGYS